MPEYVYVLGMNGKPQMPTKRKRHVQKLLNTSKARIAEHVPFTIQLLYENESVLQPVIMSENPGRTNIGAAAVDLNGKLLFSAVVETRNEELAKRFHTMLKAGMLMRKLLAYGDEKYKTMRIVKIGTS